MLAGQRFFRSLTHRPASLFLLHGGWGMRPFASLVTPFHRGGHGRVQAGLSPAGRASRCIQHVEKLLLFVICGQQHRRVCSLRLLHASLGCLVESSVLESRPLTADDP